MKLLLGWGAILCRFHTTDWVAAIRGVENRVVGLGQTEVCPRTAAIERLNTIMTPTSSQVSTPDR
jgi:hypothetical protein